MQYTEKELKTLIEKVEKEFETHLAKVEGDVNASKLAKSEGAEIPAAQPEAPLNKAEDKKEEAKEEKPEEKKEEKKDEAPAEHKDEAPKAESEAKPEEKQAEASAEHKEEAPKAEDHCDYDDEDHEHMHKMYMSMSKGELKAHHDAVRKALDGHMEKCGDMQMSKTETQTAVVATESKPVEIKAETVKQESQELDMLKSEVEAHKAEADKLKKNLDAVQEFLTKFVKKAVPQGKAITSLDVVAKSEGAQEEKSFSKSEVTSILAKKAADPSLSKSDRDAINAYYLNGANINTINHLLK